MRIACCAVVVGAFVLMAPSIVAAQERSWTAEITVGWAGLVDDATKNYLVLGGSVRRHVTPRVSIGPELVIMNNSALLRDRLMMLTGNVVFDAFPSNGSAARRVIPFVVAGGGIFAGREQFGTGPYWATDPAFTAGAGVRAKVSDAVSLGAEYRLGWELHQRLSGSVSFRR